MTTFYILKNGKLSLTASYYRAVARHFEVGGAQIETPHPFSPSPSLPFPSLPFPSTPLPLPFLPLPGKRTLVALSGENFKILVSTWPENTLPGSQNL